MAQILNIDTSSALAFIVLSKDDHCIHSISNTDQSTHASFVQPAIQEIFSKSTYALEDIDAVAVVAGPGSYTGLRVGMASAKGICYALNKPLILLDTLSLMAFAVLNTSTYKDFDGFICPLIDARRMEAFTAIFNKNMEEQLTPRALILDANSFEDYLKNTKVLFVGDGIEKFKKINTNTNAFFDNIPYNENTIALLSYKSFLSKTFASLAYSEPKYVKEFYSTSSEHKP